MVRLRRTSPDQPGWTRRRAGRGFVHLDAAGDRLSDEDAERVRALSRSSYVDPRVIDAYEEGRTISRATRRELADPDERQAALERATVRLIRDS